MGWHDGKKHGRHTHVVIVDESGVARVRSARRKECHVNYRGEHTRAVEEGGEV